MHLLKQANYCEELFTTVMLLPYIQVTQLIRSFYPKVEHCLTLWRLLL